MSFLTRELLLYVKLYPHTNSEADSNVICQSKQEKSDKEILTSQKLMLIVVAQDRRVRGVSLGLLVGTFRIKSREQYQLRLARQ